MNTALTIAGSDSSGGAGIQADIKTMTMHGVYGMSAITALTAQNTLGVFDICEVSSNFLKKQLDAVFEDIYPDAVKIGMVSSSVLIETIGERLSHYNAKNIVLDPVMISTSGSRLMQNGASESLCQRLFPLATLITPNIPEACALTGIKIQSQKDMYNAAKMLGSKYGCGVLLKGGHNTDNSDDILYSDGDFLIFKGKRVDNTNTHGTGCTLSSAIAANLAKGLSIEASVHRAKEYITKALAANLNLGKGSGPINHSFDIES